MTQEPQQGMIRRVLGNYMDIVAAGLIVVIGIVDTLNYTGSTQGKTEAEAGTGSESNQATERSGRRNYEPPQRQTGAKEVTVRLAGCAYLPANLGMQYAGDWLCDRTGGDPETTLGGPAEVFAQEGSRRKCTADGRTFWLEPVY